MKIDNLNKLSNQELSEIKGGGEGSWVENAIDAIGEALSNAWKWIKKHIKPKTDGSAGVDIYF